MPDSKSRRGKNKGRPKGPKYPWDKMEIGDRFKLPVVKWANPKAIRGSVATSARLWSEANKMPHKWATRVIDGEVYIYRVA